jgi:hypothetical protein
VKPPILRLSRVVGGWRHFSTPNFGRLFLANTACLGASALVLTLACPLIFPRSVLLIEA